MHSSVYGILILVFSFATCDELGSLIDEVFGPAQNSSGRSEEGPCSCVPYYLCTNNQLVTDGTGVIDIRVNGECANYLDVCCANHLTQPEPTLPPKSSRIGCGKRNEEGIGFRITGDSHGEAQYGEFPWMIAVLKEEEIEGKLLNVFQCGGSLITPEVVLTAAHCVVSGAHYKVRAGEWDTQTDKELFKHKDVTVESLVVHPEYYSGALFNDVALLFLSAPLEFADNIDVVCLPPLNQNYDYSRCFASGWGRDTFGKEGQYQVILKKVELGMVPRSDCEQSLRTTRLGPYFSLHQSFLCAGGESGKDTCKGDGGSPLVCPIPETHPPRYAQVGIVAWGIGCGEDGIPGVYANVPMFRNWIDNELSYRNLDSSYYQLH